MAYKGKLYGKIGNKFFDTGKNADDLDNLEAKILVLENKNKSKKDKTKDNNNIELFCSNCRFKKTCGLRIDFNNTTCDEHEFKKNK